MNTNNKISAIMSTQIGETAKNVKKTRKQVFSALIKCEKKLKKIVQKRKKC